LECILCRPAHVKAGDNVKSFSHENLKSGHIEIKRFKCQNSSYKLDTIGQFFLHVILVLGERM
jgi:hypothetical protein